MIRVATFAKVQKKPDEIVLLVTRYCQMGIQRFIHRHEGWYWLPDLAPSAPLLEGWRSGALDWEKFTARYRAEMAQETAQNVLTRLRTYAEAHHVVLACYCPELAPCHRNILKEILEDAPIPQKRS